MNQIEKKIYDIVKRNPRLKLAMRNIYQSIFDLIPDKENYFAYPQTIREGYFFGFHDRSPFSADEQYLLAHKVLIPLHMPQKGEGVGIGFWKDNEEYTQIDVSYGWNYHKGCRLQWLGSSSDCFAYNTMENEIPFAYLYSISKKKKSKIDYPIDTISPDGKYATSFSYERLNEMMPGYGYCCKDGGYLDSCAPSDTGLYLVDLKNNSRKLIYSLEQLFQIQPVPSMTGAKHYVTHTEFSPDGQYISFLHRWTFDDPNKRYTRMLTCRLDGSNLCISPTSGMVSHYVWDEPHGLLAYCQVDGIDGHYLLGNHEMKNPRRVAPELNSDGHQSYITGSDSFVTDTYPDRRRYAKIYRVDLNSGQAEKIVEVKSPKQYQSPDCYHHWACDLHPRVSPSGKWLCFDTVCTGKRALCIMNIEGPN